MAPRKWSVDSGVNSGKLQAVDTMLDRGLTPGLQGPRSDQRATLQSTLGKVDRGLLLWAEQRGIKIQVLQQGEELEATGALRDLTGQFEQRMNPDTVAKIDQLLAPLTEKIRAEKDPEQAKLLRSQKRNQLAELLNANPCGATVFTHAYSSLLAPELSKAPVSLVETPTLKGMAIHHGAHARTEQKQFYHWMEMLNGDRLSQARQASIEKKSISLKNRPTALARWKKQAAEHPEMVPVDTTLFTLVVPDAHFFAIRPPQPDMLLDQSDLASVQGWRDGDFRGQWFFLDGKTNLLIRDSAVELDTPVHELGHVIDLTLEKEDPEFYNSLRPRIERAHYQARFQGHAITEYSKANKREYIAEGFAAYYDNPRELRSKDPELFGLVDQMVDRCCGLAGADRVLDQKLQRMWQDAVDIDPHSIDPAAIRDQFEQQIKSAPTAEALSKTAMESALRATELGVFTGAAEVSMGTAKAGARQPESLADSVQQAYRQGLDPERQQELFQLGYQYGVWLSSENAARG